MADQTTFDSSRFKVKVVTPEHILVDTDASAVTLPGQAGVLEVMPGAAPLLTAVGAGDLIITGGDSKNGDRFVVARGFAEILPDRVTVLVEYASKPEEVDKGEAEKLLQEGQKRINEAGQDPAKYDAARAIVLEAEAKLGRAGQ